ncbi:nucleoside 2-deoxyribosyltransferase [Endothiovibrio diazotrophicus]
MSTIYLAGPLFSQAERAWHRETRRLLLERARELQREVEVVWPYELIDQREIDALGDRARGEIFRRCREGLERCDLLLALLDGAQVDDGTAWEIGYFYRSAMDGRRIIGIRTDFRQAGESAGAVVNAMIEMACAQIVDSRERLLECVFDRC